MKSLIKIPQNMAEQRPKLPTRRSCLCLAAATLINAEEEDDSNK